MPFKKLKKKRTVVVLINDFAAEPYLSYMALLNTFSRMTA